MQPTPKTLGGLVNTLEARSLIVDLVGVENGTIDDKTKFSKAKCKTLYLGKRNQILKYRMGYNWLGVGLPEGPGDYYGLQIWHESVM